MWPMTTEPSTGGYFADALDGREDITDSYEVLGDLPDLVGVSSGEEDGIVDQIRGLIEGEGGGVGIIRDLSAQAAAEARDLYHSDLIAAVDGTDAVAPLRFVADTLYAVGMVLVTPRTHHQPRAYVTRTRASHSAPLVVNQDLWPTRHHDLWPTPCGTSDRPGRYGGLSISARLSSQSPPPLRSPRAGTGAGRGAAGSSPPR